MKKGKEIIADSADVLLHIPSALLNLLAAMVDCHHAHQQACSVWFLRRYPAEWSHLGPQRYPLVNRPFVGFAFFLHSHISFLELSPKLT